MIWEKKMVEFINFIPSTSVGGLLLWNMNAVYWRADDIGFFVTNMKTVFKNSLEMFYELRPDIFLAFRYQRVNPNAITKGTLFVGLSPGRHLIKY